jgi:uncharacterized membrane protein YedE/YeeE
VFGFLLQKGRVAKFDVIVGQLLLRDHTVVKIMATAVIVGSVGVHALVAGGLATLHVKPALLGGVALGGVLFGLGISILGYCPGTGVAAAGAGHRDAYAGVAGMLSGALLYVLAFRWIEPMLDAIADWGEVTLPEATSSSTWLWVGGISVLLALLMAVLERQRPRAEPAH